MKRKVLALTTLILVATAAAALAATISGDGTLVGTSGGDKITAGNGNDTVWGLAGSDRIQAGDGNDMIDGDGHCPPEDQGKVFPHGIPGSNQCEHGDADSSNQNDVIVVGNGNDTVFGGGGQNAISVGGGTDTIFGGPIGDAINAGYNTNGTDTVFLGSGAQYTGSAVAVGLGPSVVHAQNGVQDAIYCQKGSQATIYADRVDSVSSNCTHVIRSAHDSVGRHTVVTPSGHRRYSRALKTRRNRLNAIIAATLRAHRAAAP